MSAAIVKRRYPNARLIGWTYGDPIFHAWMDYDRIIMCDISFPPEEMYAIATSGKEFIWLDHHKSAIEKVRDFFANSPERNRYDEISFCSTEQAACELTWTHFFPNDMIPKSVWYLGMYDSFRHKDTEFEEKILLYQYGARANASNPEEAGALIHASTFLIKKEGESIYKYLCKEAQGIYDKRQTVTIEGHVFGLVNRERFNPINFGIDYHKDGLEGFACYWRENGAWTFSLYNDDGNLDVSLVASALGGGGHKGAAGFRVNNLDLFGA
jgi:oligoribonuclease NrnB/cAMP/cGMP phosphodiesterase (DHH superfamily)